MRLFNSESYLTIFIFIRLVLFVSVSKSESNDDSSNSNNSLIKSVLPEEDLLRSKMVSYVDQDSKQLGTRIDIKQDSKADSKEKTNELTKDVLKNVPKETQKGVQNIDFNHEAGKKIPDVKEEETRSITRESLPAKCRQDIYEVKTPLDLKPIEDCKAFAGDIIINEYQEPLLSFGEIENIMGSLVIQSSPELVRIEAPNIASISNYFSLKELTSLSLISFPSLKSVKVLDWKVLPILSNAHFNNEIKDIESITVSDTSLTGFSGFVADKLEILDISNNRFLDTINSNVEHVTGKLHIAANADDVVVSLPKLKNANNMSIHDVLEIDLSALEVIDNSVSLISNHFTQLKLPELKSVGGTLSLSKNEKLIEVDFPSITEIGGGLMIVNNTYVEKINFLPKLYIIGGAIELVGHIKETSLKQLKLVKGSAKVKSSASSFDCAKWSRSEISSVIRGGKIECTNANNEKIISNTPTEGGIQDQADYDDLSSSHGGFSLKHASNGSRSISKFTISELLLILFSLYSFI